MTSSQRFPGQRPRPEAATVQSSSFPVSLRLGKIDRLEYRNRRVRDSVGERWATGIGGPSTRFAMPRRVVEWVVWGEEDGVRPEKFDLTKQTRERGEAADGTHFGEGPLLAQSNRIGEH